MPWECAVQGPAGFLLLHNRRAKQSMLDKWRSRREREEKDESTSEKRQQKGMVQEDSGGGQEMEVFREQD